MSLFVFHSQTLTSFVNSSGKGVIIHKTKQVEIPRIIMNKRVVIGLWNKSLALSIINWENLRTPKINPNTYDVLYCL